MAITITKADPLNCLSIKSIINAIFNSDKFNEAVKQLQPHYEKYSFLLFVQQMRKLIQTENLFSVSFYCTI